MKLEESCIQQLIFWGLETMVFWLKIHTLSRLSYPAHMHLSSEHVVIWNVVQQRYVYIKFMLTVSKFSFNHSLSSLRFSFHLDFFYALISLFLKLHVIRNTKGPGKKDSNLDLFRKKLDNNFSMSHNCIL